MFFSARAATSLRVPAGQIKNSLPCASATYYTARIRLILTCSLLLPTVDSGILTHTSYGNLED